MKDIYHYMVFGGMVTASVIVIHSVVQMAKQGLKWYRDKPRRQINELNTRLMLESLFKHMRCIDYEGGEPQEIQLQTALHDLGNDYKIFNGYKIEVPVKYNKSQVTWYYGMESRNVWKMMNRRQRKQFRQLIGFLMQLEKDIHDYTTKAESSMRHRNKWARHGDLLPVVYSMLRHRHQ